MAAVHNAFNCRTCTSNTKTPCKIWKCHPNAPSLLLPAVSLQSPQEPPVAALVVLHPLVSSEETLSSLVAPAVSIPSRLPIVSLACHRTGRMPERYCYFHMGLPAVPCFIPSAPFAVPDRCCPLQKRHLPTVGRLSLCCGGSGFVVGVTPPKSARKTSDVTWNGNFSAA